MKAVRVQPVERSRTAAAGDRPRGAAGGWRGAASAICAAGEKTTKTDSRGWIRRLFRTS
ncbi:MAG: hypothetical protein IKB76_01735 [Kiritimatiellae bacterium]|nr:hypothetical protein [Kiritimatiellia bacterium]